MVVIDFPGEFSSVTQKYLAVPSPSIVELCKFAGDDYDDDDDDDDGDDDDGSRCIAPRRPSQSLFPKPRNKIWGAAGNPRTRTRYV